eukprot:7968575-Pyramimonas_sp.AAC.1
MLPRGRGGKAFHCRAVLGGSEAGRVRSDGHGGASRVPVGGRARSDGHGGASRVPVGGRVVIYQWGAGRDS